MKVAIDISPVDSKPSGVGLYVCNLIDALMSLEQADSVELTLNDQLRIKDYIKGTSNVSNRLRDYRKKTFPLPVKASNYLIDYFPSLLSVLTEGLLSKADILHGTNYTVYPSQSSKTVISIYDLGFLRYPEYVDPIVEKQYGNRLKKCMDWTDAVLTISESSKQDIIQYLDFPSEKIFVTPLANRYDSSELEKVDCKDLRLLASCDFDLSKPFLLFVSTIEPRKNIITIIKSFNYLKKQFRIEHDLVLIGRKGWKYESIFNEINSSQWSDNIYHLDYVSDEILSVFYKEADVFVYPSHYEGFGLPVLEAMSFGLPVVSSNTSSIPEVVGDAAILIDPDNCMELAEAIFQVISDDQLQMALIEKGKKQAQEFSWEKTAKKTLEAYKKVLDF